MSKYRLECTHGQSTAEAANAYLGYLRAHLDRDSDATRFFEAGVDPAYLLHGFVSVADRIIGWADDPDALLQSAVNLSPWANKRRTMMATGLIEQLRLADTDRLLTANRHLSARHVHRAVREAGVALLSAHLLRNGGTEAAALDRRRHQALAAHLHADTIARVIRN